MRSINWKWPIIILSIGLNVAFAIHVYTLDQRINWLEQQVAVIWCVTVPSLSFCPHAPAPDKPSLQAFK